MTNNVFNTMDKDFFKLIDKAIKLNGEFKKAIKTRKGSKFAIYIKHKKKRNGRKQ